MDFPNALIMEIKNLTAEEALELVNAIAKITKENDVQDYEIRFGTSTELREEGY